MKRALNALGMMFCLLYSSYVLIDPNIPYLVLVVKLLKSSYASIYHHIDAYYVVFVVLSIR